MEHNEERPRTGLQINLAPLDAPHARHVLPHQLRALAGQVDDVLLTVDTVRNRSSRYRTEDFERKQQELQDVLAAVLVQWPQVRVVEVDYHPDTVAEVALAFGVDPAALPLRAADGSPFYAYLFGIHRSLGDVMLHLDSDMFIGGGSQSWVSEAVDVLRRDPQVFAVNPLPGPPTPDGRLRSQAGVPYQDRPRMFQFGAVSTRVLMFDRQRYRSAEVSLRLVRPALGRRLRAHLANTPRVVALEDCLSVGMHERGEIRVDLLGTGSGLWTLHPDVRGERFYRELPALLRRIELGELPDGQLGCHDVVDDFFDWSDVRAANTRLERLRRNLVWTRAGLVDRFAKRVG